MHAFTLAAGLLPDFDPDERDARRDPSKFALESFPEPTIPEY